MSAWRPRLNLIAGELDNTKAGKVTGWLSFSGMEEKVLLDLEGDFHRDIRGTVVRFHNDHAAEEDPGYMEGFGTVQTGQVGDMTAGLEPVDYVGYPYFEWYSENGRVVLELEPDQIEVIGTPRPWKEEKPISRAEQATNLAGFMADLARAVTGRQEAKQEPSQGETPSAASTPRPGMPPDRSSRAEEAEPAQVVSGKEEAPVVEANEKQPRITLSEAAKRAVGNEDAGLLGKVVDQLRVRRGLNYEQCFKYVRTHTGIEADTYEAMLYEADRQEAERPSSMEQQKTAKGPTNTEEPKCDRASTNEKEDQTMTDDQSKATKAQTTTRTRFGEDASFSRRDKPASSPAPEALTSGPQNGEAAGQDEAKPPLYELELGNLKSEIYHNEHNGADYYSVLLFRTFTGRDGKEKRSFGIREQDIPQAKQLYEESRRCIAAERSESKEQSKEPQVQVRRNG
jgi:hypothetical protein